MPFSQTPLQYRMTLLLGYPLRAAMVLCAMGWTAMVASSREPIFLDNGSIRVGIDAGKGGAITWLSSEKYPKNIVNIHDPGRLIQQSYYAGRSLDRTGEGQSQAWSPWPWNPIQGGGVSSWARVTTSQRIDAKTLYAETIPKLWDMPNEEAQALMKQWTSLSENFPNAVEVRCEFESQRDENDRWGGPVPRYQELPACYFTRNFSTALSYQANQTWSRVEQPPGPPWGKTHPPRNAMAFVNQEGYGVAVYSPAATQPWNFGPHGNGNSDDETAGPCMHVAPLDRTSLGEKSSYRYRYWLVVGTEAELAETIESLSKKAAFESGESNR